MRAPKALSPRQIAILECIADAGAVPPTIREIGLAAGISAKSVVDYHLNRLAGRGLIVRDDRARASRGLVMTDAGYAAIGRVSPASDAALGRALREAAQRSPVMAGVLAELEVA